MKNSESLLRSLKFVINQNLEHGAFTVSNLVRNWSIATQIRYSCRNVANWGTPNLLQRMLNKSQVDYKNNNVYRTKRIETLHMLFFIKNQILKVQKCINHEEYWFHVKQFILVSANSYFNFHILFRYSMYYTFHCELLHCTVHVSLPFLLIHLKAGTVH